MALIVDFVCAEAGGPSKDAIHKLINVYFYTYINMQHTYAYTCMYI